MATASLPRTEIQQAALSRAQNGDPNHNYTLIYQGFIAKGIPEDQIIPRENVFTYAAWKALGRSVKRGEHGVRVVTFQRITKTDKETGKERTFSRPWSSTVFHISQTGESGAK